MVILVGGDMEDYVLDLKCKRYLGGYNRNIFVREDFGYYVRDVFMLIVILGVFLMWVFGRDLIVFVFCMK